MAGLDGFGLLGETLAGKLAGGTELLRLGEPSAAAGGTWAAAFAYGLIKTSGKNPSR